MRTVSRKLPQVLALGGATLGASLYAGYRFRSASRQTEASEHYKMATLADLPPWNATFAVQMECQSCVSDIEAALRPLEGIKSLETSLATKTVTVNSSLPPSAIQRALADINRDAILRGSGLPNSAAVAILETYSPSLPQGSSPVRGLVRMVQVRNGLVLCDVGVSNLAAQAGSEGPKGLWAVSVRATGDLSNGPQSTGGIWSDSAGDSDAQANGVQARKGYLGSLQVDGEGKGTAVFVKENISIWELIGRGLVVEKLEDSAKNASTKTPPNVPGPEAVVGVVARSAGVWDNDKTVCSCSGKTVWEEREEQRNRGML